MSKKVKCMECENMMYFAIPVKVNETNYECAKSCLAIAKRSVFCSKTSKPKPLNNEQYCKHFEKRIYDDSNEKDIRKLEVAIAEYEKKLKE